MINRRILLIATALALVTARPAVAADPLGPLQYIYSNIDKGRESEPFSDSLNALYEAAAKRSEQLQEPVSGLDFDYAVNGQDFEEGLAASVEYEIMSQDANRAEVRVTFKNFEMQELRYFLIVKSGNWLVDELVSKTPGYEWTYSELLKDGAK